RRPQSSTLVPYTTLFRSRGLHRPAGDRVTGPATRALGECRAGSGYGVGQGRGAGGVRSLLDRDRLEGQETATGAAPERPLLGFRSEEHTSELQSPYDLVC